MRVSSMPPSVTTSANVSTWKVLPVQAANSTTTLVLAGTTVGTRRIGYNVDALILLHCGVLEPHREFFPGASTALGMKSRQIANA